MKAHDRQVIHSSVCPNWRTPEALYRALEHEFVIEFDLAADKESSKCGSLFFGPGSTYGEDALAQSWMDAAPFSFLNPPWSKEAKLPIEPWVEKCVQESQQGWSGVSILPASIQTKWWQLVRKHAFEIRIIPHRVSFCLSVEDLEAWQQRRIAEGKKPISPSNAGGNTAAVVWKPLTGYVGPWEASVRYWTYRPLKGSSA